MNAGELPNFGDQIVVANLLNMLSSTVTGAVAVM